MFLKVVTLPILAVLLSLNSVQSACDRLQITNPVTSPQPLVYHSGRPLTISWNVGSSSIDQIQNVNLVWEYAESAASSMGVTKVINSPFSATQGSAVVVLPQQALSRASYHIELVSTNKLGETCYDQSVVFYVRD
ncbi:hypothetical protein K7432_017761 [Basidiobolus ranarum]|uniref:Ser-Thr-rich glycosyl-phosphatidyl-inositol-anchored membrane family-domain-containing protein n=1 Tax=Basidiobolus ranarum TaxID=34480 RepID=A0ABR2VJX4_9FUNG